MIIMAILLRHKSMFSAQAQVLLCLTLTRTMNYLSDALSQDCSNWPSHWTLHHSVSFLTYRIYASCASLYLTPKLLPIYWISSLNYFLTHSGIRFCNLDSTIQSSSKSITSTRIILRIYQTHYGVGDEHEQSSCYPTFQSQTLIYADLYENPGWSQMSIPYLCFLSVGTNWKYGPPCMV